MHRQEDVTFRPQTQFVQHGQLRGLCTEAHQRVNHDIAGEMDFFRRHAFGAQIVDSALFGDEEQIGNAIGDEPVDFFRHGAVPAAQARFDVGHGHMRFGSDKAASDRRIHVAYD